MRLPEREQQLQEMSNDELIVCMRAGEEEACWFLWDRHLRIAYDICHVMLFQTHQGWAEMAFGKCLDWCLAHFREIEEGQNFKEWWCPQVVRIAEEKLERLGIKRSLQDILHEVRTDWPYFRINWEGREALDYVKKHMSRKQ